MERENLHALILAFPGLGKSTFAGTFPKPMIVESFDPGGKERPYLDRGIPGPIQKGRYCYFRDVMSRLDPTKLIIRIRYWTEANPTNNPTSYQRFLSCSTELEKDIEDLGIKTVVLDTSTFFEMAARYYSENTINKLNAKGELTREPRLHYGFSTSACEKILMSRMPGLLTVNSLVLAHATDRKDENDDGSVEMRKMVALPGKTADKIEGAYGEVYRVYVDPSDPNSKRRLLQTDLRSSSAYNCKSLLHIPDGCIAHYDALWEAWDKTQGVPSES